MGTRSALLAIQIQLQLMPIPILFLLQLPCRQASGNPPAPFHCSPCHSPDASWSLRCWNGKWHSIHPRHSPFCRAPQSYRHLAWILSPEHLIIQSDCVLFPLQTTIANLLWNIQSNLFLFINFVQGEAGMISDTQEE